MGLCAGTEEGGFVVGDVVCVGWDDNTKVSYDKSVTIITIKRKLTSRQSNVALLVLIGYCRKRIGMCAGDGGMGAGAEQEDRFVVRLEDEYLNVKGGLRLSSTS